MKRQDRKAFAKEEIADLIHGQGLKLDGALVDLPLWSREAIAA